MENGCFGGIFSVPRLLFRSLSSSDYSGICEFPAGFRKKRGVAIESRFHAPTAFFPSAFSARSNLKMCRKMSNSYERRGGGRWGGGGGEASPPPPPPPKKLTIFV